jgi:hypothetical protein
MWSAESPLPALRHGEIMYVHGRSMRLQTDFLDKVELRKIAFSVSYSSMLFLRSNQLRRNGTSGILPSRSLILYNGPFWGRFFERYDLNALPGTTDAEVQRLSRAFAPTRSVNIGSMGCLSWPEGQMQTALAPVQAHRITRSSDSWRCICWDARPPCKEASPPHRSVPAGTITPA